jgi:hypothetical protein
VESHLPQLSEKFQNFTKAFEILVETYQTVLTTINKFSETARMYQRMYFPEDPGQIYRAGIAALMEQGD